jgi:orotate phosphoribosyltransferase-like protein
MPIVKPVKGRAERALELKEKGLSNSQIKDRLGFNSIQHVGVMIRKAEDRREKQQCRQSPLNA